MGELTRLLIIVKFFFVIWLFFVVLNLLHLCLFPVPPAYYAHLAAFRARYYIEDASDMSSVPGGRSRNTRELVAADLRQLPLVKDNVKEVMFYC